ncbi:MAG: hypothetical protein ACREPK_06110 [Rhodanobacteraceae bacterium]
MAHTPKTNAHCERFNRTIQVEFADFQEELLFGDVVAFNDRLFQWLHWYHAECPTTASPCVPSPIISARSAQ